MNPKQELIPILDQLIVEIENTQIKTIEEKRADSADIDDNKSNNTPCDNSADIELSINDPQHITPFKQIKNLIYTEKEYNMIEQFIEFANDSTKYQWETTESDITDFKMEYIDSANAVNGMCIARGTAIIECNPEYLFFGYDDYTKIKDLDENCLSVELKYKYDDHRRIMCSSFKAPPPAWYREFVFKEIRSLIDDEGRIIHKAKDKENEITDVDTFANMKGRSSVCLGYSIESDECPFEDIVQYKHVRCDLKFGGYYFESIGDNKCKAIYLVCMDLKGWIPVWFQNMLLPQQSKNILTMKKYIESLANKMKNNVDNDDIKQ